MSTLKKQRGFAIVELMIGLVVIVAISFVGYTVYKKVTNKKGQETPTNQTAQTDNESELKFDSDPVSSDPIGDKMGPFYHDIYLTTGQDGLTFNGKGKKLIEHASVPDIIRLKDGRLAIYAVDAAKRSKSGLLVGISKNGGETWQFGSVRFNATQNKPVTGADPEVVLTEDGKIRLYLLVHGGGPAQNGMPASGVKNKVQSALSTDGINFTPEDGVRVEYAEITDPDVIRIGDIWYAYISQGPKNIAFTSADGLTFNEAKTIRGSGSVSNTVDIGDNQFRQYYCGGSAIKSAVTTDGLNFTDDSGNRLEPDSGEYICDPAPVKVDSTWLMVYKVGHN